MNGCRKSDLFDHTLVFPKVQEVLLRHVMSFYDFDVVAVMNCIPVRSTLEQSRSSRAYCLAEVSPTVVRVEKHVPNNLHKPL